MIYIAGVDTPVTQVCIIVQSVTVIGKADENLCEVSAKRDYVHCSGSEMEMARERAGLNSMVG